MIVVRRWPCDDSLLSLDQLPFCPGVLQTSGKFCLGKFSKFLKQHQHTLIFNNQEDNPLQKWFSFRGRNLTAWTWRYMEQIISKPTSPPPNFAILTYICILYFTCYGTQVRSSPCLRHSSLWDLTRWICQNWQMDYSKLQLGFIKTDTGISLSC